MTLYLVRHAHAGSRGDWKGADDERPLSLEGKEQARAITRWLADRHVDRVLSSPHVRCQQTVAHLARKRGLEVEVEPVLEEGAAVEDVLDLIGKLAREDVVLCSHGDVLPALLAALAADGVELEGGTKLQKGAIAVLDVKHGAVRRATLVGRPKV